MELRQFYLGCLAHASYLIGDGGEAAIVDPQRDVDEYLEEARARGLTIRHVIETHLHADFVSGHRELAQKTGAAIYIGHQAGAQFPHVAVRDGMQLRVGRLVLTFLETPGHTPESISVLVADEAVGPGPRLVLTGDTLFIGDVGRPDLVGSKGRTAAEMAGLLYDSLHQKLLTLPDDVEVYPAHGAGSQCGRFMSQETSSTIGAQRRTNYALQPMTKDEFIHLVAENLPPPPRYFAHDAEENRLGAPPLAALAPPARLSAAETAARIASGAVVLDVRDAAAFGRGHVPGAVNIGLGGQFASWAGSLLLGKELVIVAEDEAGVREAQLRLARVGVETVSGFLDGGVGGWAADGREVATLVQLTPAELAEKLAGSAPPAVIDVRRPAEYDAGHVPGAKNVPLDRLDEAQLPAGPTVVICAGGYRSSAGCSLLQRRGFAELANVAGGTTAWVQAGLPVAK